MPTVEPPSLSGTRPFAVTERCDRCGARATVRAVLASGADLLFCGHHAREHDLRLRREAVALQSVN
jgi:hypothetical protein